MTASQSATRSLAQVESLLLAARRRHRGGGTGSGWSGLAALAAGGAGASAGLDSAVVAVCVACTLALSVACIEAVQLRRRRRGEEAARELAALVLAGGENCTAVARAVVVHGVWGDDAIPVLSSVGLYSCQAAVVYAGSGHDRVVDDAAVVDSLVDADVLMVVARRERKELAAQLQLLADRLDGIGKDRLVLLGRLAVGWRGSFDELLRSVGHRL